MTDIRKSCPPSFRTFGLAVQAMVVLAINGQSCPSCVLAERLHSEATLLRRIMGQLARAGLIETREGRDGGYRLLRQPDTITLAEIYKALQINGELCRTMEEATGPHPFGIHMKEAFTDLLAELDHSMLAVMQQHTVGQYAAKFKV
ncbi:Rrf2 family transcriptional regulator [Paenibacillus sp. PR3]|uniref:Rrf2 family transcriptional regulator n=1 Tax=Paenibacillus terricola TaxID=2763503 RepID=A0ABR8MRM4_9BACL|nr:Rrf2 family transcriptional regulator [Paenibacillus terricola]MBD3918641.1 Rrf2 family transcriptional regulator [Paenibacillus terricola]